MNLLRIDSKVVINTISAAAHKHTQRYRWGTYLSLNRLFDQGRSWPLDCSVSIDKKSAKNKMKMKQKDFALG